MAIMIDMEMPKDCKECPFMATDGKDTLSPMMCVVIWGKNHEIKHCIQGKIRDDCPLKEVPTGKWLLERAIVRCSNCGKGYKEAFGKPSAVTFDYCPNCSSRNVVEKQQGEE